MSKFVAGKDRTVPPNQGTVAGVLTSVFKHSKTTTKHSVVLRPRTTLTRKSVSNQDVSVETKNMGNVPIHGGMKLKLLFYVSVIW